MDLQWYPALFSITLQLLCNLIYAVEPVEYNYNEFKSFHLNTPDRKWQNEFLQFQLLVNGFNQNAWPCIIDW